MAGGLFGQPFVLNEKCIFFALIIMCLFLYKPTFRNVYTQYATLFVIFVIAYVSMAYYDSYFDCTTLPLKKGSIGGITGLLKPQAHEFEKQVEHKETPEEVYKKHMLIYAGHLIFIVPLLAYIAYQGKHVHPNVYPILGATAGFTFLYHGYGAYAM